MHGRPDPIDGEDEKYAAEALSFGVLLAMMSADRGGHHDAADLCEAALTYMAALPAWRDVSLRHDAAASETTLTIDTTSNPDAL